MELRGELAQPCPRASDVIPDPATATWEDLTIYAVEATQRGDLCADKVDKIHEALPK